MHRFLLCLALIGCTPKGVEYRGTLIDISNPGARSNGGVLVEKWPNVEIKWRFACASGGCNGLDKTGPIVIRCDKLKNHILQAKPAHGWQPEILQNCKEE